MARSGEALSRERIVAAAVAMLDRSGENGLTFRALSAELKTGAGAIYWHVPNKGELLAAAADAVLSEAGRSRGATPEDAIRAVALDVFDAIEAHPWVGAQLSRPPSQLTVLRVFEQIGQQVQALGVPAKAQFHAASALFNYILGVAGQNAANAQAASPGIDLPTCFDDVWASLDADAFPFLHAVIGQLRNHDDRTQFLAGVDLILAGIRAS